MRATLNSRTRLPTVSVIIAACSMDRWDDLLAAVASAGEQTVSVLETVAVIDHNPGLPARARNGIPDVTVIPNMGRRGASGARNSGVAASRGEVVAFLDDDAVASPSWLESLLGARTTASRRLAAGGKKFLWQVLRQAVPAMGGDPRAGWQA